jgi:S1-C subfamily serine protease
VGDVTAGGPAAEAGVQPGDIILEVDEEPLKDLDQFNRKIQGYKPRNKILLLIGRITDVCIS